MRGGVGGPRLHEVTIRLAKLPPALDGFAIVQMTDIHIGPTLGRGFMRSLVDRANALDADIVAITGDLVDGTVEHLREHVAPLAELRARHGVFFVTGNHEYYSGADAWIAELQRLGIRVLQNEHVTVGDAQNLDAQIDIAGVYDHSATSVHPSHTPDVERALAGRDPSRLLCSWPINPKQLAAAACHGVDLQLSCHTHGGQIWLWSYMSDTESSSRSSSAWHASATPSCTSAPAPATGGPADAPRHPSRDHAHHASSWLVVN